MTRDSSATAHGEDPVKCEEHDLFYNRAIGCFKCNKVEDVLEALDNVDPEPPQIHDPRPIGEGGETARLLDSEREAAKEVQEALDQLPTYSKAAIMAVVKIDAPSAMDILAACLDLALFLSNKNKAYGDSALKPVRIVSKSDAAEQIRVRIDDKLSRLVRGEAAGEDALTDLVGYYILLKVAEKNRQEATP
jgi:hypothetical protein